MHTDDKRAYVWLTVLYGVLLLVMALVLSGCGTERRFAIALKGVYTGGAVVSCPFDRSSLLLAPACA